MRPFHPLGYETCVHSRKRRSASWKVYESCPNPGRLWTGKGYELPYQTMCLNCPFYTQDGKAKNTLNEGGSHFG